MTLNHRGAADWPMSAVGLPPEKKLQNHKARE
jgi:hypothetical protein